MFVCMSTHRIFTLEKIQFDLLILCTFFSLFHNFFFPCFSINVCVNQRFAFAAPNTCVAALLHAIVVAPVAMTVNNAAADLLAALSPLTMLQFSVLLPTKSACPRYFTTNNTHVCVFVYSCGQPPILTTTLRYWCRSNARILTLTSLTARNEREMVAGQYISVSNFSV